MSYSPRLALPPGSRPPGWRRVFRRASFWGLAALLLVVAGVRLGAAPAARFAHFSVEQGLSQGTVQAILQDRVGFLWFGTDEGLNRYDGYTFTVFKHDPRNPRSLPNDKITALLEDRERQLWVGTGAGLSRFDPRSETFSVEPAIRGRVTGLAEAADGTLWIGVEGYGVFARHPTSGAFVWHQKSAADPASFASYVASVLFCDRAGQLWIGTRDAGIEQAQPGGRFLHLRHDPTDPQSLPHNEVWGLAEDATGNLWVATYGGGLAMRDRRTGKFRRYQHRADDPQSLPTDLLTSVFVDRSGTLWVGTDGAGVLKYDAAADRFTALVHDPVDPGSLSQNVIHSLYEDRQAQIWVGTYLGGADVLRRPRHAFDYYTHSAGDPASLSDPTVASFLEDATGQIWVGTERGGLNRFDPGTGRFTRYRVPSHEASGSAALTLHQDRRGRFWVGTYRAGLARFDPAKGTFAIYRHRADDPTSLSDDEVWTMAEDETGALWLGTNAGLDRFDPEQGIVTRHFDTPSVEGRSSAGVRALLFDAEGTLWIGTIGGLDCLRRGADRLVRYRHDERDPKSLSLDSVVALAEDRQGRLWAATFGGGIDRLDRATGSFTAYRDFPSNVIYRIQVAATGHLWISTNFGLSQLNPDTGEVKNFDLTNGLQSLQFHLGASLGTRNGRLLFGSVDGFYYFDPTIIKPDTYAPPVVLTALRVFNEPVKLPAALSSIGEVTLPAAAKVFSLDFAALDYTLPRHNGYAYIMEGFTDRWLDLEGKREVTFTNLDPGEYVFRVKASNSDGIWQEASTAAVRVIVEPPFWGRWWFRGLVAAALLGLAWVIYRARRTRREERERAQEALRLSEATLRRTLEEHARIGRDLHDGVIQTLYAAGMGLAGIRAQLRREPAEAEEKLDQTRVLLNETIRDVRNFITGLEPEALKQQTFTQALERLVATMQALRPVRATIEVDEKLARHLPLEQRAQALQIAREAVSNALRHGAAGQVCVALQQRDDHAEFTIDDNGCGFDPATRTGTGRGLKNLAERAAEFGAELTVDSKPGKGTHVKLVFPLPVIL